MVNTFNLYKYLATDPVLQKLAAVSHYRSSVLLVMDLCYMASINCSQKCLTPNEMDAISLVISQVYTFYGFRHINIHGKSTKLWHLFNVFETYTLCIDYAKRTVTINYRNLSEPDNLSNRVKQLIISAILSDDKEIFKRQLVYSYSEIDKLCKECMIS